MSVFKNKFNDKLFSSVHERLDEKVFQKAQSLVGRNALMGVNVTLQHEQSFLSTMSDHKVMELIYETHVHADESFDEDSLYAIVKNILYPATRIVDKIVQGSQVQGENIEEFSPKADFSVPLCTLKQIGSEFCCKAAGHEIVHNTTMSILNKLSNYEWEAKAVLTIAAFALEYGDFWLLAQNYNSDLLFKSLAILKRVPILIKPLELRNKRDAIIELNNVIKVLLQVIQLFDEFEKVSIVYNTKDVPSIKVALDNMPVDVYWTIVTIVACATKLNILISDEEQTLDLSPHHQKVHYTLNKLRNQLTMCRREIDVILCYQRIIKITSTPTEIMEVIKALIFIQDEQHLIDGSTKKLVTLEVLRRKYVLLFISGIDISDEDIQDLKQVHEGITKKDNNYKIVWIPIVEQWNDELRERLETVRAKMTWYIIPSFSSLGSLKFIKEVWNFKGEPKVVVLNPQGKLQNKDALHLIKVWKIEAFPFDDSKESELSERRRWVEKVLPPTIHPSLSIWFKEEKYIFFYGGKDSEWIQQFTKKAIAFTNEPIIRESNIKIELVSVGKTSKGGEDLNILARFWSGIDSLFFSKNKKPVALNPLTQEIQKLLSYKNESGWVILCKGSSVVLVGHGFTIMRVLEEFDRWKDTIREKGFEIAFKYYLSSDAVKVNHCCRLDIPSVQGSAPEIMKCPECPRVMATFISYQCCHIDGPAGAYH